MATEGDLAKGAFYTADACSTDVTPQMRVAQEEIFGPVLSIIEVETLEEAIAVNNDTRYGLSAAIFTRDINAAHAGDARPRHRHRLRQRAAPSAREIQLPFGGTRGTGNGHREAGTGRARLLHRVEERSTSITAAGSSARRSTS